MVYFKDGNSILYFATDIDKKICMTWKFNYLKPIPVSCVASVQVVTCHVGLIFCNICSAVGWEKISVLQSVAAWKVSKCGVISGKHFPVFGLNTAKYGPEKTPYLNTCTVNEL